MFVELRITFNLKKTYKDGGFPHSSPIEEARTASKKASPTYVNS